MFLDIASRYGIEDAMTASWVSPELNDGDIAHLASINAQRETAQTLDRVANALKGLIDIVGEMKTDVALLKQSSEQFKDLDSRVRAIEMLHAQQAGAFSLVGVLKDYGGWLVALAAAAFAFIKH